MQIRLADVASSHHNHFNLIRFLAASLVLFSHSYPLTGYGDAEPLLPYGLDLGDVAVLVFFATSGFLVTASLERSSHIISYVWARSLRIFPALIVANLLTVFILGLAFTTLPANTYLHHEAIYSYLARNTLLLVDSIQYRLPGVFADNPYPNVVNGSLWTLPRELKLYLQLAGAAVLIVVAKRFKPFRKLSLRFVMPVLALACAARWVRDFLEGPVEIPEKYLLSTLFFTGSALYAWRHRIVLRHEVLFALGGAGFLSLLWPGTTPLVLAFALPWLVVGLAYAPGKHLLQFNRCGDYSYGIYIYAFPVQQALAASFPHLQPLTMAALAFPPVLLLAVLSWSCVEKPCLALKRRLVSRPLPAVIPAD